MLVRFYYLKKRYLYKRCNVNIITYKRLQQHLQSTQCLYH